MLGSGRDFSFKYSVKKNVLILLKELGCFMHYRHEWVKGQFGIQGSHRLATSL